MHRLLLLFLCFILSLPLFADNSFAPLLNTVTMQFNAEQWVQTKTAVVSIGVNASVSGANLETLQNDILHKLNKISNKGEWHIVSFNQSLDQSGLERVQMRAEGRIASGDLGGLRDRAKAISVPGETFTLDNVDYTPSEEEFRNADTALRNNIYSQAKAEIDNLNKLYPDQKFYLHNVNFLGSEVAPSPLPQNAMAMVSAAGTSRSNIAVGNKLRISATVIFASESNANVTNMVHN